MAKVKGNFICVLADLKRISEALWAWNIQAVSKENYADGSYTIRDIIYRLRAKLDISNIQTLHGYGYKFSVEK